MPDTIEPASTFDMNMGADTAETIDFSTMDRGDTFEPDTAAPVEAEAAPIEAAPVEAEAEAEAAPVEAEAAPVEAEAAPIEAEAAPVEAEAEPKKSPRIPKERFDEVNERMKSAEKKLQEFETTQKAELEGAENTFDYDAKETEYMEAVIDGRLDDANAIRNDIRSAETAAFDSKLAAARDSAIQDSSSATQENIRFTDAVAQLESQYDVINPNHDDFSVDVANEVVALRDAYQATGLTATTALRKAVRIVALDEGLTANGDPTVEVTDAIPDKKVQTPQEIEKNIAAAASQPGQMENGSPAAEGKIDIMNISDADFANLSQADLKALRGDSLTV